MILNVIVKNASECEMENLTISLTRNVQLQAKELQGVTLEVKGASQEKDSSSGNASDF